MILLTWKIPKKFVKKNSWEFIKKKSWEFVKKSDDVRPSFREFWLSKQIPDKISQDLSKELKGAEHDDVLKKTHVL